MWPFSSVSPWLDSSSWLLDHYRSIMSSGYRAQQHMRFCPSFVNRLQLKGGGKRPMHFVVKTKIRLPGSICWLGHITFTALTLHLSFLICKNGISKKGTWYPPHKVIVRIKWVHICRVLKTDWLIINTIWVLAMIIDLDSPNDLIITIILRSSVRESFRNADMLHALFQLLQEGF